MSHSLRSFVTVFLVHIMSIHCSSYLVTLRHAMSHSLRTPFCHAVTSRCHTSLSCCHATLSQFHVSLCTSTSCCLTSLSRCHTSFSRYHKSLSCYHTSFSLSRLLCTLSRSPPTRSDGPIKGDGQKSALFSVRWCSQRSSSSPCWSLPIID